MRLANLARVQTISGVQESGSEKSATFGKAGKYGVRRGIHPKIKLKVVVN